MVFNTAAEFLEFLNCPRFDVFPYSGAIISSHCAEMEALRSVNTGLFSSSFEDRIISIEWC